MSTENVNYGVNVLYIAAFGLFIFGLSGLTGPKTAVRGNWIAAVGMGVAWVSLIAAEMISGQFGVGYFTWEAYSLVNYPAIVLGMITIGVLGLACSGIIRMVGVLMMPWLAFAPGSKQ